MKTLVAALLLFFGVAVQDPQGPPAAACGSLCRVTDIPFAPPSGGWTYDLGPFPGHGVCSCWFTTCLQESPCSDTLVVTYNAGAGKNLCWWDGTQWVGLGVQEPVTFTVYGCGDDDSRSISECPFGTCATPGVGGCVNTFFQLVCPTCDGGGC